MKIFNVTTAHTKISTFVFCDLTKVLVFDKSDRIKLPHQVTA